MTNPLERRRWLALGVIALVQFMLVLDVTVVNVALPSIQTGLHFSRGGLAWVVDGYVLTAGGLLLLGGRLGDLLGRRRLFIGGVLLFALASAASGAAVDPAMLVASRFVQGAAEALASPAAFGLVALLFPEATERAKAIGIFGGVAGLGGTLGPVVSGLLISVASWRWIFFVNIPVGVFAAVATVRLVAESRADSHLPGAAGQAPGSRRPDIEGALLGTAGLVGAVYGFIRAGTDAWGAPSVALPLAAGAVLLAAFVWRERRAGDPLVPTGFMRNRTRVSANVGNLLFASVFFTLFYLLTLYLQQVEHYSALRTGVAYLPFGIVIGLGIAVASSLVTRVGMKPLLVGGSGLVGAGVLALTRITVHGSYLSQVLPALVVVAFGAGLCFAAFGNASMHEVSGQDASVASGIQSTFQQVGGAVGLAVLATMALRDTRSSMSSGVAFAAAATRGTTLAFAVAGIIGLASAFLLALAPIAGPAAAPAAPQATGADPTGRIGPLAGERA